jgi:hypothetical protein
MKKDDSSTSDKILDLLLDALIERQQARQTDKAAADFLQIPKPEKFVRPAPPRPALVSEPVQVQAEPEPPAAAAATFQTEIPEPENGEDDGETAVLSTETAVAAETAVGPPPLPSVQLDQMLRRLALGLALLILIVNIPFNRFGTSLARAMPDVQSLIVRDGLVLKGSGDEIYVLENNQKRWITTLDAFAWHGYRWEQVNQVEDAFLNRFEDGRPIYVLLKCEQSPHIYALEAGQKRWIEDIPTFEAEGFVWEDVKFTSCGELRNIPSGVPFPPDAGPVPEP